jgi:hypothetical protein
MFSMVRNLFRNIRQVEYHEKRCHAALCLPVARRVVVGQQCPLAGGL